MDARRLNPGTIVLLLAMAGAIALGLTQFSVPQVVPASAPAVDFSAARALRHLEAIAQEPRPTGSQASTETSKYLTQELTALGLQVEVQATTSILDPTSGGMVRAGSVRNVIARLPGTNGGQALALIAHYDSVSSSPGAMDDGAGVAAILETVRALQAGAPLRNDLIVVLADGEEAFLLGSHAFVEEHPWAKDIRLALNTDAGGLRGPSIMNDSTAHNGWLIKGALNAGSFPFASSFLLEVGRDMMRPMTDLTSFKKPGVQGISFVTLMDARAYHTWADNVARADERALQHRGNTLLALAHYFGNMGLETTAPDNQVFFSLFPGAVVRYSARFVPLWTCGVALVFVAVLALGFRRKQITPGKLALGSLAYLLSLVCAVAIGELSWRVLRALNGNFRTPMTLLRGLINNGEVALLGFVFLIVAVIGLIYLLLRPRLGTYNLVTGAMVWWLAGTVGASLALPGASYVFTWPLLFGLLALALAFWVPSELHTSWRHPAAYALAAIPALLIWTPIIWALFQFFGFGPYGMPGVVLWGACVALLVGLLLLQLDWIAGRNRWLLPAGAALCGVILLGASNIHSSFGPERPVQNHMLYELNADTGVAFWIGGGERQDSWTAQFLTHGVQKSQIYVFEEEGLAIPSFQAEAPSLGLPSPEAAVLSDTIQERIRSLDLGIRSPRGAPNVVVRVTASGEIQEAILDGKEIDLSAVFDDRRNQLWLAYSGVPEEGFELALKVNSLAPLQVVVDDRSDELPVFPGLQINPRPAGMMPAAVVTIDNLDGTKVVKSFSFSAPSH